jgi:hypothetical protein
MNEISHKSLIKERKVNDTLKLNLTVSHEGITPQSKINGTNVTLGDIIKHGDKISAGSHVFNK